MIGEINLFGVFVPALLAWAVIAVAPFLLLRALLQRVGFYRFVWHRPLADFAMFIILLAALSVLLPDWLA